MNTSTLQEETLSEFMVRKSAGDQQNDNGSRTNEVYDNQPLFVHDGCRLVQNIVYTSVQSSVGGFFSSV